MVLKAVLADVMQQALQVGNAHYPGAPKGVERIVRKFALADVAPDLPLAVVRREAGERHRSSLHQTLARPIRVFAAYGPGNDLLEFHPRRFEEMLRQVAAMETDRFVRVFAVIV